jgi:hypothetical protein
MKHNSLIAVILAAAAVMVVVLASALPLEFFEPIFYYRWKQERMVKRVMGANPEQLLSATRQLLQSQPGFVGDMSPSAAGVPGAIRRLRPTKISIGTNAVRVEFSDVFNPFGIIVYAAGVNPPPAPQYGRGPREWIDGLWVYDDGQLETYRQPVGPVNGSQPVRPETNRTASATGSRR